MKYTRLLRLLALFPLLMRGAAADGPDLYDRFYADATSATLNLLTINVAQVHSLGSATDQDWATFWAAPSISYTIRVEAVGADVDPELVFYPNGPDDPFVRLIDNGGYGAGESIQFFSNPAPRLFWLRVRPKARREGATGYQLIVTRTPDTPVGLGWLSGVASADLTAAGGQIMLPSPLPAQGGATLAPRYAQARLAWPDGTFPAGSGASMLLGGIGDPLNRLDRPWIARWLETRPGNLTPVRIQQTSPLTPLEPLQLDLELLTGLTTATLTDGALTSPSVGLRDVPPAAVHQVRIMRWNSQAADWLLYDPNPIVTKEAGRWMARTWIASLDRATMNSDFFAAEAIVLVQTPARAGWALYD